MCKVLFPIVLVFGVMLVGVAIYGTFLPSDTCNAWCKGLTWAGFLVMTWTTLYFSFSASPRENIVPCCDGRAAPDCDGSGPRTGHPYTAGEIVDVLCLPCTVIKAFFCWPCWVYECQKKKWAKADELANTAEKLAAAEKRIAELTAVRPAWENMATAPSAPPGHGSTIGDPKVAV